MCCTAYTRELHFSSLRPQKSIKTIFSGHLDIKSTQIEPPQKKSCMQTPQFWSYLYPLSSLQYLTVDFVRRQPSPSPLRVCFCFGNWSVVMCVAGKPEAQKKQKPWRRHHHPSFVLIPAKESRLGTFFLALSCRTRMGTTTRRILWPFAEDAFSTSFCIGRRIERAVRDSRCTKRGARMGE